MSENTVKNYVYRIFNKPGVSNRVEVVMYAASQRTNLPPRRTPTLPQLPGEGNLEVGSYSLPSFELEVAP